MLGAWLAQRKTPAIYEAFNRHDLEAVLASFADDVTFIFPGDVRASGVHTGKEAVKRWFEQFFAQFPTLRFTVRQVGVANLFDTLLLVGLLPASTVPFCHEARTLPPEPFRASCPIPHAARMR